MTAFRLVLLAVAAAVAAAAGASVPLSADAQDGPTTATATPQFGPIWDTSYLPQVVFMGEVNTAAEQARTRDAFRQ